MVRTMIFLTLLTATLVAQPTVLTPTFESTAPSNADNTTLIVVQPARHGDVVIYPQVTGPTGWQAMPVLSLSYRPEMDNLSLATTYASLDVTNHLMFPNPQSQIPWWLMLVGPLVQGTLTPWTPIPFSDPFFREYAYSYQNAALEDLGGGAYNISFSNGGTAIHTDGVGAPLTGAPVAGPGRLGEAMAVGDFNGDGVDDLAVGAPDDVAGGLVGAGRVYIYVGLQRVGGFAGGLHQVPYILEEPDLSQILIGENPGPEHHARFGGALAAGDLDGDGIDELVVGVPRGDGVSGDPDQGEAYVFRSLETPLPTNPLPIAPTLAAVSPGDITQVRPAIEKRFMQYGLRMTCGDLDNDQIDDLVVGAPLYDESPAPSDVDWGAAYIFKGPIPPAPFTLEDERIIDTTPAANERFGSALQIADIDGDLLGELIVGVPGQGLSGIQNAGKISVWSYAPTGSTEDSVIVHPLPAPNSQLGKTIGVGDLDGDGNLDVITGADEDVASTSLASGVAVDAGMTYVFRGPAYNGNHEILTTPPSASSYDRFGSTILVTDLNADGWDDIVSSAPGCDANGMSAAGRVFVYFGSPLPTMGDDFRSLHLDSDSPTPLGFLGMTLAAGDFAGAGVNDLVCAEPVATGAGGPGTGRVVVYTDLLHRKDNLTRQDILNGVAPNQ